MAESEENYKFDLGVKGLGNLSNVLSPLHCESHSSYSKLAVKCMVTEAVFPGL